MSAYLRSNYVRAGLILLVLGSGPLIGFMTAAKLGWGTDPDPNPVFLGIAAGLTFWPSLVLIGIGIWRVRRSAASDG